MGWNFLRRKSQPDTRPLIATVVENGEKVGELRQASVVGKAASLLEAEKLAETISPVDQGDRRSSAALVREAGDHFQVEVLDLVPGRMKGRLHLEGRDIAWAETPRTPDEMALWVRTEKYDDWDEEWTPSSYWIPAHEARLPESVSSMKVYSAPTAFDRLMIVLEGVIADGVVSAGAGPVHALQGSETQAVMDSFIAAVAELKTGADIQKLKVQVLEILAEVEVQDGQSLSLSEQIKSLARAAADGLQSGEQASILVANLKKVFQETPIAEELQRLSSNLPQRSDWTAEDLSALVLSSIRNGVDTVRDLQTVEAIQRALRTLSTPGPGENSEIVKQARKEMATSGLGNEIERLVMAGRAREKLEQVRAASTSTPAPTPSTDPWSPE
jgi:hypothetical protein